MSRLLMVVRRLLGRAAQGERASNISKMSFWHQSPKRDRSTIRFPSTTIPVVKHGKHHEIQFM
jgi:hypothetical protein